VKGSWTGEVVLCVPSGQQRILLAQISTIGPDGASPFGLSVRDITADYARETELRERNAELVVANTRLKGAQEQIIQSEKLASIGQLAAGVAHEINNPIGYVNSNLSTLQQYVTNLLTSIDTYTRALVETGDQAGIAQDEEIRRRFDIDFLAVDLPQLLVESREGIERVCKIVRDLKDFSRRDGSEAWVRADIHRGLDSTLNIVWNELKYKAQIVRSFGELPLIDCLPSELNQVFMNVLMNAGQAITERGVITVSTGTTGDRIWIAIGDDGEGIPADVLPRIFDPFFTTKPVGSGTGLGLAISYGIIAKHHGTIEISSLPGQGTMLRIELPVEQPLN
jgi:signal transduction histidine kinase